MSYSVNLYGHKDFDTPDEVEAFELDVIKRVTDFAHSLPGLSGGTINTAGQPQTVLQPSDGATATNPDGSPIEPQTADEETPETPAAKLAEVPLENPPAAGDVKLPEGSGGGSPANLGDLSTAELQAEIARRSAQ